MLFYNTYTIYTWFCNCSANPVRVSGIKSDEQDLHTTHR